MANVTINVTLTPVQYKAFQYVAASPEEWIQNAALTRAISAIDYVFESEVKRMVNDPNTTSIPADKETVVMNCTQPIAAEQTTNPPL